MGGSRCVSQALTDPGRFLPQDRQDLTSSLDLLPVIYRQTWMADD